MPAAFLICEAHARFGNRSHSERRFFLHDWEWELCFRALGGWLRKDAFFSLILLSCCYSRQAFVTGAGWEGLQELHRGLLGGFFFAFRFAIF